MAQAGRLMDLAQAPPHPHGCPPCAASGHPHVGPAVEGSDDVLINFKPALRIDDPGVAAACCGPNTWKASAGSGTVLINDRGAHRVGDETKHCQGAGTGKLITGSADVLIGD
jgi:uncharacterized Zn-binding protein involved in type VI secretion